MAGIKLQVTLPKKLVEELVQECNRKDMTKSVLIALALDEFLAKKKGDINAKN